jgi:hypothetical protein
MIFVCSRKIGAIKEATSQRFPCLVDISTWNIFTLFPACLHWNGYLLLHRNILSRIAPVLLDRFASQTRSAAARQNVGPEGRGCFTLVYEKSFPVFGS